MTFAITDIHGCLSKLIQLVETCEAHARELRADCEFIFLGDYIDRGPDSAGVVGYVRELVEAGRARALMGNHDMMMAHALCFDADPGCWASNGMSSTLVSYGYADVLRLEASSKVKQAAAIAALKSDPAAMADARWLSRLPLSIDDNARFFVHAGVDPTIDLDQQRPKDCLWIRDRFLNWKEPFSKYVVHGHTVTVDHLPDHRPNRTNLDTGCYAAGNLTAGIFSDTSAEPIGFLSTTHPLTFL